jgi:hypothetical protein
MSTIRFLELTRWQQKMVSWGICRQFLSSAKTQHRLPLLDADSKATEWADLAAEWRAGQCDQTIMLREPWKISDAPHRPYIYRSDIDDRVVAARAAAGSPPMPDWEEPWLPACDMPSRACHIILTIIAVRRRKLHDLTENDACDEGVWRGNVDPDPGQYRQGYRATQDSGPIRARAVDAFHDAWDAIYGDGAWDLNPDIVALSFRAHSISPWLEIAA